MSDTEKIFYFDLFGEYEKVYDKKGANVNYKLERQHYVDTVPVTTREYNDAVQIARDKHIGERRRGFMILSVYHDPNHQEGK